MRLKAFAVISLYTIFISVGALKAGSNNSTDKNPSDSMHIKQLFEEFFDKKTYKANNKSEIKKSNLSAIDHFIKYGFDNGSNPAPWFDMKLVETYFPTCGSITDLFSVASVQKSSNEKVVVSITSHPPRIDTTWLSVLSILKQETRPDHTILYLASEDFPNKVLPKSIEFVKKLGLEVRFSDTNYKVATKLIPALKDFPDDTIVTADDDRIYRRGWLKTLLKQHRKHPQDIIAVSARKYIFNEGHHYGKGKGKNHPHIDYLFQSNFYDNSGFGIFEGFAGVLYPPHALNKEVFNFDNFKVLTPYADDVWFQTMAILQGTKVRGLSSKKTEKYKWPYEVEGTQASGLFHKHLRANDWMAYRALYYYGLLGTVGIPSLKELECQACNREIQLYEPKSLLVPPKTRGKHECSTCLNSSLKRVLCIGAYDYGNIGDHIYKLVLKHYLDSDFETYFMPDTVRVNDTGQMIGMNSKEADLNFDALIIGGGGIIKQFSKTGSIGYYMELAIKKDKPFFVVSTGLQTDIKNPTVKETFKILGDTANLLKQASLIFVRSVRDSTLLSVVLGEEVAHKLFTAPDLGYLYPDIINVKANKRKYITLIQTGSASVANQYVRGLIDENMKKHPDAKLLVMNWGGVDDPSQSKDFQEYDLFKTKTKEHYPDAKVYMGGAVSPELKQFRYSNIKTRIPDLTPEKAIGKIAKSHVVITGRYHGYVIARKLGIPVITPISSHKVTAEKESPLDFSKAESTMVKLKNFILWNSHRLSNPRGWNEDDRNTNIVKTSETFGLPIPHIQSMDNISIFKLLAWGSLDE